MKKRKKEACVFRIEAYNEIGMEIKAMNKSDGNEGYFCDNPWYEGDGMPSTDIEIFVGSGELFQSVFSSFKDYEDFREEFYSSLKPAFEKLAEARCISEEKAMHRRCR